MKYQEQQNRESKNKNITVKIEINEIEDRKTIPLINKSNIWEDQQNKQTPNTANEEKWGRKHKYILLSVRKKSQPQIQKILLIIISKYYKR